MVSVAGQARKKTNATTDLTVSERPLNDFLAEVSERTDVRVGVPLPLGTYALDEGVNFALFSRDATRVRLELFDHPEDAKAARVIDLDPARNRTGDVWHVWIEGIRSGQLYAYRVDGPYQPRAGQRFNFNKLLLDPFAPERACSSAVRSQPDSRRCLRQTVDLRDYRWGRIRLCGASHLRLASTVQCHVVGSYLQSAESPLSRIPGRNSRYA
jgi:1,4-alpha-glucan branching enzyme